MLGAKPALAEVQAYEILKVVPGHVEALLLLAAALRLQNKATDALAILKPLALSNPNTASIHFELGLVFADQDARADAIRAFSTVVRIEPLHGQAWRALADQLWLSGDEAGADSAYASHIKASVNNPRLMEAASALCDNRLPVAERLLRSFLMDDPTDVAAIRMLAEVAARLGLYEEAEKLLARAVELAPSFDAAQFNYAIVLHRQGRPVEALAEIDALLEKDARHPGYRNLHAAVLARLGETDRAIEAYAQVLQDHPNQPKAWMSLGHTLKAAGRQDECVAAYRKSIALLPTLGEAYWSLANLKTFRFTSQEISAMSDALQNAKLEQEDRFHLHFALGKALEDEANYAESFLHYDKANAVRRTSLPYKAEDTTAFKQRLMRQFTPEFFAERAGCGSPRPDPIFVVGLPRSGSTLIEQILSSHTAIEGTMELPDIMSIAKRLGGGERRIEDADYPQALTKLDPTDFEALGEEYLQRTAVQRRLGRPFFVDKMPNNFLHVGLIHLILPNAKIIDARRHPLACCFSCFKQHFARGQGFTYSLSDIGRYYADYVELMAHVDAVLPDKVHRVLYEEMVENPEREVRRLLDYCEVPFEERCLEFYRNKRVVRTASAEQVRVPIYTASLDQWRHYEPWLEPLKVALAPMLEAYATEPKFDATR